MTTAPDTLVNLQNRLVRELHTVNLGIVGDDAHVATGGYHIGAQSLRRNGMGGDYSLQYGADQVSHDFACAIDIGGSPHLLQTLGNRLVHALKQGDPRVYSRVRATNAPYDGWQIDRRYDCENPNVRWDDNTQSSDDRNHIHVEFYRSLVLHPRVMDDFFEVMAASDTKPNTPPAPHPPKPGTKIYQGAPVPALIAQGTNQYFGSISGPNASHGGYNQREKGLVKMLQQRLIVCGFVPGHTNPNDGWADGIFDTPHDRPGTGATSQAVSRFQHAHMPGTKFFGQVWYDDWTKLFNL